MPQRLDFAGECYRPARCFRINAFEQGALQGLLPLHQVLYLLGLRPYMDFASGIIGVKRRISHQSLIEALYVEPHSGYRSGSPSRDQIRRGLQRLMDVGLLQRRIDPDYLIFYCPQAMQDQSVQKQVATKPPPQAARGNPLKTPEKTERYKPWHRQAAPPPRAQAATPLVSGEDITHTLPVRVKSAHVLPGTYEPPAELLRQAQQWLCEGAKPEREPLERAKFVSYHRARGNVRCDWNAEYLGWLLRTVGEADQRHALTRSPTMRTDSSSSSSASHSTGRAMARVLAANHELLHVHSAEKVSDDHSE